MYKTTFCSLAFLLLASAAQAEMFPTEIAGNVNASVSQGSSTMVVIGANDSAKSLQSTVTEGSHIGGNFNATSASGADATLVLGVNSTARNSIASFNGSASGNVSLHAYTGAVVTAALGNAGRACTAIANVNGSVRSISSSVGTGTVVNVGIGGLWSGKVSIGSVGNPC